MADRADDPSNVFGFHGPYVHLPILRLGRIEEG
jgi:hypothetical protein